MCGLSFWFCSAGHQVFLASSPIYQSSDGITFLHVTLSSPQSSILSESKMQIPGNPNPQKSVLLQAVCVTWHPCALPLQFSCSISMLPPHQSPAHILPFLTPIHLPPGSCCPAAMSHLHLPCSLSSPLSLSSSFCSPVHSHLLLIV